MKYLLFIILLFSYSLNAQTNKITTNINIIKFDNFNIFLMDINFIDKDISKSSFKPALSITNENIKFISQNPKDTNKKTLKQELYSSEDQALYQAGKKLFDKNDFIEAESILIDFLQKYPDSKYRNDATYTLAEIMFKLNRPDEAIMYYNKIIQDYSKSAYTDDAYYKLGLIYFKREDYGNGLKYLSIMQEKFKNSPLMDDSFILKGQIYVKLKNYKQAINAFETVVKDYPHLNKIDEVYFHLGDIYKKAPEVRDIEKSAAYFQKIIDDYPQSAFINKAKEELKYLNDNFLNYK